MMLPRFKYDIFAHKLRNLKKMFTFNPSSCLKIVVLFICILVMLIQLEECWVKVRNPPIITHTRFTLNETVLYPALTICRQPPYNKRYYKRFNFTDLHLIPYPMTSNWNEFPYDKYNISEFWDVAVYNSSFLTFGLNDLENDPISLESSLHLTTGMCHTIRPLREVPTVSKKRGYNILLRHDLYNHDPLRDKEPGWFIYVHEVTENFSENINIYSGRQAEIFVPVGEKVYASLEAYQFNSVQNCSKYGNYSLTECEEDCWINEDIAYKTNCSGPWFPKLNKPYCSDANGMIDLVKATVLMPSNSCCQKSCRTTQYKISIVKRTQYPPQRNLTSGASIYFGSKAIVTIEEKYGYNWNVFIADLGGSVGFLLGLSVIGIIGYVERVIQYAVVKLKQKKQG